MQAALDPSDQQPRAWGLLVTPSSHDLAMSTSILFPESSFCFTGAMAHLKRKQAEQEVRARGGHAVGTISPMLDFLVVGSKGSRDWKYGRYGNKIAAAQELIADGSSALRLIDEQDFLDALATCPPTNSGEIDGMVLVVRAHFWTESLRAFDRPALERLLGDMVEDHNCHVRLGSIYVHAHRELFGEPGSLEAPAGHIKVEARLSKHYPLDADPSPVLEALREGMREIEGVDPRVHWTTHTEGSVEYLKLLRSIPSDLRVPDL